MPVINKKSIREKNTPWKNYNKEYNNKMYSSMSWHRLRKTFLSTHPLCMECLRHGRVNPAEDIHHVRPWNRGKDEIEKWNLFLNENNLIALCETCHLAIHDKDKKYHLNALDGLTDAEYNEAHITI